MTIYVNNAPAGPTGPAGPPGPTGATGSTGATGPAGVVTATTYDATILAESSLVGYWPLDEAAGATTALDKKGTNNGSANGGVTFGSDSALIDGHTSVFSDGVDDYIQIPDVVALKPSSYTAEIWARVEGTTNGPGFWCVGAAGFTVISNGAIRGRASGTSLVTGDDIATWSAPPLVVAGAAFMHLVVTWDNTTKRFIFYRNAEATYRKTLTGSLVHGTGEGWRIAGAAGTGFTVGNWAKAAVYNAALTKQQVRDHYLTGIGAITA